MDRYEFDEQVKERIKHPSMYAVIYHNDHVTTADFVVESLVEVFDKDILTAQKLMKEVDQLGQSMVGIYTRDIATTKKDEVLAMAKAQKMPFQVTVEPVNDEEDDEI